MDQGRDQGREPPKAEEALAVEHGDASDGERILRPPPKPMLQAAIRRARVENAARSDAVEDLRDAEYARLDLLRERLVPIFDEIPDDCDMFDLGLAPGPRPRLFVDMIGFVELAHDRRSYRFLQDTRFGRLTLAESESIDTIAHSVADYVARRLVEREKALAADAQANDRLTPRRERAFPAAHVAGAPKPAPQASADVATPRERPTALRVLGRAFVFLVEVLGSAVFFGLIAAGLWWLWTHYGHLV